MHLTFAEKLHICEAHHDQTCLIANKMNNDQKEMSSLLELNPAKFDTILKHRGVPTH